MEEAKKLYSQNAIAGATFFGGPAAAGFLVKKNYEQLGQRENAQKAFFIGIIATLLIFAAIFAVPENVIDKIPNALIPAVYTVIIYLLVERLQGAQLKSHKAKGGQFYSGGRAAGIGAIFMVVLLVSIAAAAFFAGDLSNRNLNYDAGQYQQAANQFTTNENKALQVFSELETASPEYLIDEFRKGIELWETNKAIVNDLDTISGLPQELITQNELLLQYCNLRISQNEVIIKAIAEDTDIYTTEIEHLTLEINNSVDKLTGQNQ
ncbi:hypothetical protein L21SP5_00893 [Salinivirga cyanobacteriivorans]|uniref:Uncharacterized protein n=1 Tax=Salinivirga cyanobacteriivorans TaxID=1307839 RepID=A0A0S2HWW0_9BACT|nr:hypothetical protein [Salinivirga cyanobacteriivorans]ALO14561.1 hypothetical protein L21SP5_00893 [Salinivirga cyanobacteriivorans]